MHFVLMMFDVQSWVGGMEFYFKYTVRNDTAKRCRSCIELLMRAR